MSARQAYIARHRFLPGAFAYLNAQVVENGNGAQTLERWLTQGALVEKVALDQAVRELQLHLAARTAPDDLPIMLRRQAD